jgi:hypothetical protein
VLLEWLFERRPGPVGSVDVTAPYTEALPLWQLLLRFAFAAIVVATAARVIMGADQPLMGSIAFVTYLLAGYLVRPRPDHTNTGILGFVDHPLKWTDDVNRFLIFLRVVLLPGRITAAAIRDVFAIALGRRRLRPPAEPRSIERDDSSGSRDRST